MAYDRKGKDGGSRWYEQKAKKPGSQRGSEPGWVKNAKREGGYTGESGRPARAGGFAKPSSPAGPDREGERGGSSRPQPGTGAPRGRFEREPRRSDKPPRFQRPEGSQRPGGFRPSDRTERPPRFRPGERTERPIAPPRPEFAEEQDLPRENLLAGRNPIREALKSGRDMEKLLVARGDLSGSARELIAMAKERHIVVQEVDRVRLDALAPGHQGMVAFASAFRYAMVEDMMALAKEREEPPFLVILDGITDPHNLGAIIRSAECAGAHGVIVPERRAVGLTPAAVKASAGAVEYLPVARVGNIPRLIDQLKEQGVWIYAAVTDGERYDRCDLSGPLALVIGAEGEGVSRLVLEKCDHRVALPLRGRIASLNASVAAGVLLYEVLRHRQLPAQP